MSATVSSRVGWCPGALRPMRVGDGMLVRVKPRGNRLTVAAAIGIAGAARAFGNGVLTITGRANLQIRGVSDETLAGLTAVLARHDLLDPSLQGEAARNVIASPLAGADPEAAFDIRPVVAALEHALVRDRSFHSLPAKFNWSIDDGGALGLDDVPGDVRFCAVREGSAARFRVSLADDPAVGFCEVADIVPVAAALAGGFLALCAEHGLAPHRMADLVAMCGAPAVLRRAGLAPVEAGSAARRRLSSVGLLPCGDRWAVGVASAFGRLEADALDAFASAAARAGTPMLGLTPWRTIIVAGLEESAAVSLQDAATAAGLITDPADPRLAVAACAGDPACRRASAPVQAHAARWARLLRPAGASPTRLHVSGCAKGCAHGSTAPLTLVARAGLYDLVQDGRAGDAPSLTGLTVEAVAAMLARNPGSLAEDFP